MLKELGNTFIILNSLFDIRPSKNTSRRPTTCHAFTSGLEHQHRR